MYLWLIANSGGSRGVSGDFREPPEIIVEDRLKL